MLKAFSEEWDWNQIRTKNNRFTLLSKLPNHGFFHVWTIVFQKYTYTRRICQIRLHISLKCPLSKFIFTLCTNNEICIRNGQEKLLKVIMLNVRNTWVKNVWTVTSICAMMWCQLKELWEVHEWHKSFSFYFKKFLGSDSVLFLVIWI